MRMIKCNPKNMREVTVVIERSKVTYLFLGKYTPLRLDIATIPDECYLYFVYKTENDGLMLAPWDLSLGHYKDFFGTLITTDKLPVNNDGTVFCSIGY